MRASAASHSTPRRTRSPAVAPCPIPAPVAAAPASIPLTNALMDGRVAAGPWSLIAGGHRFLAKLSPSETHRRPMEGAMEAHRAPLTKGRGNDGPSHTA